ncbi:NlpC/P60 family protein [Lacticaseibacillus pabuli]|uniref:NlpC/P60 family protein n=1 Tax=Lacticaseibacillus pabuli TaxID=3025672 RepID=A0ABY7WT34_9LACO|nr:NlpC/P60 family protein [Lacticaseibacillus sp. KACC 23028]WDF83328.1 NlpC/P60 family protein [Lacticaseibacillus sp. KACC 23028]
MKRTKLLITAALAVGMTLGSLNVLNVRADNGDASANAVSTITNASPIQAVSGEVQVAADSAQIVSSYQSGASVVRTLTKGSTLAYTGVTQYNGQTWYQVGSDQWINAAGLSQVGNTTPTPAKPAAKPATKAPVAKPAVKKPVAKPAAPKYQTYRTTVYVAYVPGYGVRTASKPGAATTGKMLKNGSAWKTFAATSVNGTMWYELGTNVWVPSTYMSRTTSYASTNHGTNVKRNVIRVGSKGAYVFNNALGTTGKRLKAGTYWKYFAQKVAGNKMWYEVSANQWVHSAAVSEAVPYQNPSNLFQVSYSKIKPAGQVGYNLGYNYEGVKTWLVLGRLGMSQHRANMTGAAVNAVARFQRSHGLRATGVVDVNTWVKMGFKKAEWYNIDAYTQPLRAQWYNTRSEHIEAMIKAAYQYVGKPYIVGASSSPYYGTDCSGLVTQALYAAGISPLPVSSIQHAHPGNEWNCRPLAASGRFKTVSYANRQRGDLIFYTNPSDGRVWHVAIYLGGNRVIESWPPRVMVASLKNGQRSYITRVARVFN